MGMVVELEQVRLGVVVDGIYCGALLYADDVVFIADGGGGKDD